jgi:hypothetical protein
VVNEVTVLDNLASSHSVSNGVNSTSSQPDLSSLGLNIDTENLSRCVRQVLGNWSHVFSKGSTDIGCTDLTRHRNDDPPFKQPYRKIPPGKYEEVRQHLKDMLDCGLMTLLFLLMLFLLGKRMVHLGSVLILESLTQEQELLNASWF